MHILIIGSGIAGLTTAIALEKQGFSVEVFESAPELRAEGAGIWMAVNAMQVFSKLGIASDVVDEGYQVDSVAITNHTFKSIQDSDMLPYKDEYGYTITAISRQRLRNVLMSHVKGPIHTDCQFVSISHSPENTAIYFANGRSAQGDLIIGADGIHSTVRRTIFKDTSLRYSGQTCWRGIANLSMKAPYTQKSVEAWGNRIRFGFSAISPAEVYWFAVQNAPEGQVDEFHVKSTLQELFKPFLQPVADILEATPEEAILRNDIHDLNRLSRWSSGNICLVGDAAHATTPNMGQGGCQAIEDAWVLSHCLAKYPSISTAFERFEQIRRPKVDYVVNTSWQIGKMAHLAYAQGLRNMALRATPQTIIKKQMAKMFSITAIDTI